MFFFGKGHWPLIYSSQKAYTYILQPAEKPSFFLLQKHAGCQNILLPWHLPFRLKSHFNCSGFTCCSHSSMLAIVNHTPFSPKVLDTPTSHNSNLELESAVAPAGPLPCFIHLTSNGVIQKAVIFPHNSPFCKQWPCRIWWFTIPAKHLSCHFLQEKM